MSNDFPLFGAFCFGLMIGWVTYRTLRRSKVGGLSDIATVIGAVGGAAVTGLFPEKTPLFGWYCIGLAVGFFAYLGTAIAMAPRGAKSIEWLGGAPSGSSGNPGDTGGSRLPEV